MVLKEHEKIVGEFYNKVWPEFVRWWNAEEILGIHYAYYDNKTKSFKDAIYNMNNLVGKFLHLTDNNSMNILDAGCGVGGTSIYLGKKHPNCNFTGVTIAPDQIQLANKFSKERNAPNTKFLLSSFCNTPFNKEHFDGVFALESMSYTERFEEFVDETQRVLKPGGRLVVIDGFGKDVQLNPIMQALFEKIKIDRGTANIHALSSFISYLKKQGFVDIQVKDITMNVSRSQLRATFIGFLYSPLTFSIFAMRFISPKRSKNLVDHTFGTSVLASVIGLSGSAGFYAISAVKG